MNKMFGLGLMAVALTGLSACSGSETANAAEANAAVPADTGIDNNVNVSDAELGALANETTPIDNGADNGAALTTVDPAGNAL